MVESLGSRYSAIYRVSSETQIQIPAFFAFNFGKPNTFALCLKHDLCGIWGKYFWSSVMLKGVLIKTFEAFR